MEKLTPARARRRLSALLREFRRDLSPKVIARVLREECESRGITLGAVQVREQQARVPGISDTRVWPSLYPRHRPQTSKPKTRKRPLRPKPPLSELGPDDTKEP